MGSIVQGFPEYYSGKQWTSDFQEVNAQTIQGRIKAKQERMQAEQGQSKRDQERSKDQESLQEFKQRHCKGQASPQGSQTDLNKRPNDGTLYYVKA